MIRKEDFILGERRFSGYKLGWVELSDRTGMNRHLQAYFVTDDKDFDEAHMLVVNETDGDQDDRFDDYAFLSYYGVAITRSLVWMVDGAVDVPEIVAWFPEYEQWGCR